MLKCTDLVFRAVSVKCRCGIRLRWRYELRSMFVVDLAGADCHVVLYDLYERMLHNEDFFDSDPAHLRECKLWKVMFLIRAATVVKMWALLFPPLDIEYPFSFTSRQACHRTVRRL